MTMLEYDHARFVRYSGLLPHVYKRAVEKRQREEAAAKAKADAEKAMEAKRRREELDRAVANLEAVKSYRCITVIENGAKIPAREIIAHIAALHGVPVAEILGRRRSVPICAARHAAMKAVADHWPDLSLPQIGKLFGGRDHTTFLHAIQKLGGRAKQGGSHV